MRKVTDMREALAICRFYNNEAKALFRKRLNPLYGDAEFERDYAELPDSVLDKPRMRWEDVMGKSLAAFPEARRALGLK
jgi:hypothetical protein